MAAPIPSILSGNTNNAIGPENEPPKPPNTGMRIGTYYTTEDQDFPGPSSVEIKGKDGVGTGKKYLTYDKKGKPAIFNRYSIFFVNQQNSVAIAPEDYLDSPNRIKDEALQKLRTNPTSSNIIAWSREGKSNAVEYAWEDFLWCRNYGRVPNNYMVTLRRFKLPPEDDLFSKEKNMNPDIARLITWVDGDVNKWESVGLKWNHKLNFKQLTAELQTKESQPGYGNEAGAMEGLPGGGLIKSLMSITDTAASTAARTNNPATNSFNPYENENVVFGPIDVIKTMQIRDTGLEFKQDMTVVFEYELRSIDGVNPRVAMLDLLSNIMICTMNRGTFWGGDVRYYGGNPRQMKPIGDPDKLAAGDYSGYFDSLVSGISGKLNGLSGGKGLSWEGIKNAAKTMGGNLMSQIAGGALDKMGRPGVQALNALLSGESTGEWHLMVGNPANPIISIGNLVLTETDVEVYGALGFDDFPSKVRVTCKLAPARPRDRTEILGMFSRNGRTYLTSPSQETKYAGNRRNGGQNGGVTPRGQSKSDSLKLGDFSQIPHDFVTSRFPNHSPEQVTQSAKTIR
jgi:hypothetical protein